MTTSTLYSTLKNRIGSDWTDYTEHSFVEDLGAGTLPLESFKDYLVQDYLFLIQFCRAYALAAAKADTLEGIRSAVDALSVILRESELHVELTGRWGIDRETLLATPEKVGTVAYTRYVLDVGHSASLLDLQVALAPCVVGYAEIGADLAPQLQVWKESHPGEQHPYAEWIEEYAGEGFQAGAAAAVERLDELSGFGAKEKELTEKRLAELTTVFRTATRMESAFWQQALTD